MRYGSETAGHFTRHTFDAPETGPRVVVLGGVHGDETEGVAAASRLVRRLGDAPDLIRGRVDVVPVCHEAAFAADSRVSPVDGKNLARVFPGAVDGTATEQLAHHLTVEVLAGADLLIDLHTSGTHYDMPFLAGYGGETPDATSTARTAAEAFGADFVWRHTGRSVGRTTSVVDQSIYAESPGFGPLSTATVDNYVAGVLAVLVALGLRHGTVPIRPAIRVTGGGDLDRDMLSVGHDGVFLATVGRGDAVAEGGTIGTVMALDGTPLETITSRAAGRIMALKRRSPVQAGDLVACVAAQE